MVANPRRIPVPSAELEEPPASPEHRPEQDRFDTSTPTSLRSFTSPQEAISEFPYHGGNYLGSARGGVPQGPGTLQTKYTRFFCENWAEGLAEGPGEVMAADGTTSIVQFRFKWEAVVPNHDAN